LLNKNKTKILYQTDQKACHFVSAILRECFPISVLLGSVTDPLTPEDECRPRDISEPGTSGKIGLG
jgi:hypothetical protein